MPDKIFQATDLVRNRTDVLAAARLGRARLRDTDGTSLVMLPEGRLVALEELAEWSTAHLRLSQLLCHDRRPSINELGSLAWLRVFDVDDLREFLSDLEEALVAAHADQDVAALRSCLEEWRVTARQLEDPLRRSVLLGKLQSDDLVEALKPDDQ